MDDIELGTPAFWRHVLRAFDLIAEEFRGEKVPIDRFGNMDERYAAVIHARLLQAYRAEGYVKPDAEARPPREWFFWDVILDSRKINLTGCISIWMRDERGFQRYFDELLGEPK